MHIKWHVVARFQRGHCADVIPVAVGVDDELWREVFFIDEGCDALGFVAWIDENGLARGFIVDDVAIFFEWPDGMILSFIVPLIPLIVQNCLVESKSIVTGPSFTSDTSMCA